MHVAALAGGVAAVMTLSAGWPGSVAAHGTASGGGGAVTAVVCANCHNTVNAVAVETAAGADPGIACFVVPCPPPEPD